jgi:hypothetical protein
MKNGGSLTINPETGLPEAGFLKKLLPMIAGFALGPAGFGLMSAAGAGLTVGAVTGLATGSLSKGLMAGLGAYGGAGLGEAFMGAGANAVGAQSANLATSLTDAQAQALGFQNAATAPAANAAATSNLDKIGAGFKAVTDSPSALGQFAKDNWKMGLAAASPFIADAMVPTTTKMPAATPGYIRPYQYDANTRTVKAMDPVLASEWGARQFPDFIRKEQAAPPAGLGQQLPPGMARGGIVALADGGETDPYARYNTLSGQSKAAYDYLMGNAAGSNPAGLPAIAPRPVVSNTNTPPATTTTTTPATTTDPMMTLPVTGGGGGGGGGGAGLIMGGASVGNAPSAGTDPSPTYSGFVPEPPNHNIPVVDLTPTPTTTPEPNPTPEPEPVSMPPDPYPYPEPEPEPPQVLPWEPPPYEPEPEPDPNFFEPGYGNTGTPEPVPVDDDELGYLTGNRPDPEPLPYQGDPYDYVPVETDVVEPAGYEVQPWENVDNPGTGSMAGDVSVNSGNNTYVGPTDDAGGEGMPDAFGSYPGDPTYIGDDDELGYLSSGNANGGLMGIRDSLPVGYNEMPNGNNQFLASGGIAGYAAGGMSHLGGYSDGGRLLKGPGDGVSDSIPATIGKRRQPARLADGEFVIPARIVSELGNGSTDAGARKLYAMMDRIQKSRGKTVGKGKVAANSRSEKYLPA